MDDGAKTDLSVVTIIPQLSLSLIQFWIQYIGAVRCRRGWFADIFGWWWCCCCMTLITLCGGGATATSLWRLADLAESFFTGIARSRERSIGIGPTFSLIPPVITLLPLLLFLIALVLLDGNRYNYRRRRSSWRRELMRRDSLMRRRVVNYLQYYCIESYRSLRCPPLPLHSMMTDTSQTQFDVGSFGALNVEAQAMDRHKTRELVWSSCLLARYDARRPDRLFQNW